MVPTFILEQNLYMYIYLKESWNMAPPSSANLHRRAGAAPPPGGRGAPNPGPLPQSNKISRPGAPILQSLNLDTIKREKDVKEYKV